MQQVEPPVCLERRAADLAQPAAGPDAPGARAVDLAPSAFVREAFALMPAASSGLLRAVEVLSAQPAEPGVSPPVAEAEPGEMPPAVVAQPAVWPLWAEAVRVLRPKAERALRREVSEPALPPVAHHLSSFPPAPVLAQGLAPRSRIAAFARPKVT